MQQTNDINQIDPGGTEKLRPIIENLETSILLWYKNLKNFIFVYWEGIKYALIPLAIIFVLNNIEEGQNLLLKSLVDLKLILIILVSLLAGYFIIRAQISLFLLIIVGFKGEPKQIYRVSGNFFWEYTILIMLILLPILFAIPIASFLAYDGLALLTTSGLYLFLAFSLYLVYITYFTLSIFELFNAKNPIKALKGSVRLVAGNFWSFFGRILFIMVILLTFSFITALPVTSFESGTDAYYAWLVVAQIINFLVTPIVFIYLYNIYMDLIKIKGGK